MEIYDDLTGGYNKWEFFSRVQEILANDSKTKYDIICSNIKNFKLVNDLFGIAAGDNLINQISDMLKNCVQQEGLYARLEADKFAVFVPAEMTQKVIPGFLETGFCVAGQRSYVIHIDLGVYEINHPHFPDVRQSKYGAEYH